MAHAYLLQTTDKMHLHSMLRHLPRQFISVQTILHAVTIGKIGELSNVFDLMQTLRVVRNSLETELSELGYGTYVHRGPTASWSEDDTETLSLIVQEILCRCGVYTGSSLPLYDFYPSILGTNAEKIFLSIPMSVLCGKHVDALCSMYPSKSAVWVRMMRRVVDAMRSRGFTEDCLYASWCAQWSPPP